MAKKKVSDRSVEKRQKQEEDREERLVAVLLAGIKAKKEDPSISKEDIIAAAKAAYKVDPEKSGH